MGKVGAKYMAPKLIRILAFSIVFTGLSSAAHAQSNNQVDADKDDSGVWRASAGVNYSEGDYGDTRKTKVVAAPIALKYSRGGFSVRVSVPYVHIDGPGSLLDTPQGRDAGFGDTASGFDDHGGSRSAGSGSSGSSGGSGTSGSNVSGSDDTTPDDGTDDSDSGGSGGADDTGSGGTGTGGSDDPVPTVATSVSRPAAAALAAAALPPANRRSGIGDVSVTLGYSIDMGADFYVDLSGRIKLPTASKARRLGTGKVDFTGGVDLVKDIGKATLYAGARHKFMGTPAGTPLRDVWGFGAGASYRLPGGIVLGADYDWQQSSFRGNGPSSEMTGWANLGLSRTVRMQAFASTGFTRSSADFAGGLSLSWRFR